MQASTRPHPLAVPWPLLRRQIELGSLWRIGLLRIVALLVFYVIESSLYFADASPTADERTFHFRITVLCGAWLVAGVVLLLAILFRQTPRGTAFWSAIADGILLTAACSLGSKALSPLVIGYPLLIVLCTLGFDARVVVTSTLVAIVGYLALLGLTDRTWFDAEHTVPLLNQGLTLATLLLVGCASAVICRQARRLVEGLQRDARRLAPETSR